MPNDIDRWRVRDGFYETVTDAVQDISAHGFDSIERVRVWIDRIRKAAVASAIPDDVLRGTLNQTMQAAYDRLVTRREILKIHPGISRFTLDRVKPKLRAELDRRIMASANLIKMNREQAIEKTIQRFSGWATSIPAGGSRIVDKVDVKDDIRKFLATLKYEERRIVTDQGHKFVASLNDIMAIDGGALAAIWRHHHVRYPREDHVERAGKIFLIRGSWAHEKGLVKPNENGYTDQIEQPGFLVLCRCSYQYVYGLSDLPTDMLTQKGSDELARIKKVLMT